MTLISRRDVSPRLSLWLGLILFLSLSACSGAIKIERIPTPTPIPSPTQAPVASGAGTPRRIVVDKINLDAPVVEMGWSAQGEGAQAVSVWNVPENEAGWHINSAQPGQNSNVVISGHNNSTGGHVFGQLEALEVGDQINLWTAAGTAYTYQISETQIVRAFAASQETLDYLQAVTQPTAAEQLTLITCWPGWSNTHRLIIIAHPI